jgi:hypothetical protein
MKKFLAVAAVLSVTSVHAADLKFGDLNYFFKQGQFNLKSDFDLSREETRVDGSVLEVEGYKLTNKLTFGVMDNLNVFVGLNYLFRMDTKATQTSQDNGLQNPILGADFRVMNQGDAGFNLDVGAVVDYNLMDSEVSGTNKTNGNQPSYLYSHNGDPRSSVGVNARLGKKWDEANEFYTIAAVNYNMAGEQEELSTNNDREFDGSMDLKLGAFYQYRPVNEFMMTFGLTATRFGEVEGEINGSDFTIEDHIDYQFTFNAKYLITDTFIAKFNFSQDRRGEYDVENEGGADNEFMRRRGNSYGVGVDWLF